MANIETDVLIVGTGPTGSVTAALLARHGVANMVVNRYRWLPNTPRAHHQSAHDGSAARPRARGRG